MDDSKTYSVGEFARLAGVTVRTLHFYDEAGLLTPSRHEDNQRRQYQRNDLLRLQQILTLKYLGFSLQEIENLLATPTYDVKHSLRIQKEAVEQRILQLQGVSFALSRTLETLEQSAGVAWEDVVAVIRGLSDDHSAWQARYFPPDEWAWLKERAAAMPPEYVEIGAQAWRDLYDDFRSLRHLPPDHPDVQAVAERMHRLGAMFTQGKPEIEQGLREMYRDVSQIPEGFRVNTDQALQDFMTQAFTIYREHPLTPSPSPTRVEGSQEEQERS